MLQHRTPEPAELAAHTVIRLRRAPLLWPGGPHLRVGAPMSRIAAFRFMTGHNTVVYRVKLRHRQAQQIHIIGQIGGVKVGDRHQGSFSKGAGDRPAGARRCAGTGG